MYNTIFNFNFNKLNNSLKKVYKYLCLVYYYLLKKTTKLKVLINFKKIFSKKEFIKNRFYLNFFANICLKFIKTFNFVFFQGDYSKQKSGNVDKK
jgi:hypothetical protein